MISNHVEFLVVGALAVAWHGYPRYSAHIDFLVRPTAENGIRVLAALKQFGFGSIGITLEDLSSADKVVQFGYEPNCIDVMTSIAGVSFEEAWNSKVTGSLDNLEVHFIGREALIRNKQRPDGRRTSLMRRSLSKERIHKA